MLRAQTFDVRDEMNVHPVHLWVSVLVDFDLGEECHCLQRQSNGHDSRHITRHLLVDGKNRQLDSIKILESRQDELYQSHNKVVC